MKTLRFLKSILVVLIVALLMPVFGGNVIAQQKDGNKPTTQQTSTKKSKHRKHRKHHKKHKKSSKNTKSNNSKESKK